MRVTGTFDCTTERTEATEIEHVFSSVISVRSVVNPTASRGELC